MDALPEEVFKLLNERPSVTCGAALLSAVYDCPADCRPMQQLLARWGAPAAAAKLVEGEWAQGPSCSHVNEKQTMRRKR